VGLGGPGDRRYDVLGQRARSGHPGDGAGGQFAGEAHHRRREGGEQHRGRLGAGHVDRSGGRQRGAPVLDLLAPQQRQQHVQVLPHPTGRAIGRQAEHAAGHGGDPGADAEREAVVDRGLHAQCGAREHQRVALRCGHHRRAEPDTRNPAGHGEGDERVPAERLADPGRVEAAVGGGADLTDELGGRGGAPEVPDGDPDLHVHPPV
jgi:hypothetical protein